MKPIHFTIPDPTDIGLQLVPVHTNPQLAIFNHSDVAFKWKVAKPSELSAEDKRRYYLHRRLDPARYKINAVKWTIEVPYPSFENIPVPDRYYVKQLHDIGYQVQFNLF
ncbi:MAG: hypothetical protein JWQ57_3224 [Mucilaginibacter sp.]|nr:hypothetical protein [Mucilaginibacter sp.]